MLEVELLKCLQSLFKRNRTEIDANVYALIRCIARKFLFIWIRKTFGRVTLSKARLAYKTRLVHKCWKVWNGIWWEARKEWGLGIRADLHNRYRLWNLVMAAWKTYTAERRVKSAKNQLALDTCKCFIYIF